VTTPLADTATPVALSAGVKLTGLGKSSSSTVSVAVTEKKSVAAAEITVVWAPSAARSSTPLMVNVAEVSPSRIVTVAGTVAAAVLLLDSVTTSGPAVPAAALRVTVPVVVPPFSLIDVEAIVTVTVGASAVVTLHVATSAMPA